MSMLKRFSYEHGKGLWISLPNWIVAIRGPALRPLYSERNRCGVRVIPLGRGWRITVRRREHG